MTGSSTISNAGQTETISGDGTVIVTGASKGIGAATAKLLAARGYSLVVNYLSDDRSANSVVSDIVAHGGRAIAVAADISCESDVDALFEQADREAGSLVGLVNNAATVEVQTGFCDIDVDRFRRILETNVIGSFLCAKEAVRRMSVSRGGAGGSIVNVSSIAARTGSPGEYVDYAASKGALDTMTTGLAREVAHDGIRVNAVRPGFILTTLHEKGGEPERVKRLAPGIPMRRGGSAGEVANAIAWLISKDSSYSTGAFIDVGGGV